MPGSKPEKYKCNLPWDYLHFMMSLSAFAIYEVSEGSSD